MDGGGQGGSDGPTSSSAITTGDWYNIAFVKNGTTAKLYFNGVQVLSRTVANRSYSNPRYFYLGGNSRSTDLDNYANMDLSKFIKLLKFEWNRRGFEGFESKKREKWGKK